MAGTRSVSPVTRTTVSHRSLQMSSSSPAPERHVRLLLLPTDECAAAQGARLAPGFEVAELDLYAGRLEGREVRHLTSHRAGVSGLAMVGHRREVHDRRDGAAARESVEVRPTKSVDVEPAE